MRLPGRKNKPQPPVVADSSVPWQIIIYPTNNKEVVSNHPGLSVERAVWIMEQIVADYKKGLFEPRGT